MIFLSHRTLFCIYPFKENLLEKLKTLKFFKTVIFGLVRSTAGRAELLCRSTGRSTDMHQCALCTSVDRPGRPSERAELSVCSGRPARSTDSRQSLLTDSNGYIFVCLLLGFLPTNLLAFLTQFSSPINKGSVLQLKYKIYKLKIKVFQSLAL